MPSRAVKELRITRNWYHSIIDYADSKEQLPYYSRIKKHLGHRKEKLCKIPLLEATTIVNVGSNKWNIQGETVKGTPIFLSQGYVHYDGNMGLSRYYYFILNYFSEWAGTKQIFEWQVLLKKSIT